MQRALRMIKIVGIVLVIFLVAALFVAYWFGQLLNVLYTTLIFLAFFSLLATALLIYAIDGIMRSRRVARL